MTVARYRRATRRLVLALMVLGAPAALAQQSAGIPGVISPGVEPELVQEGFTFTEGPVGAPDGGLYFNDIRVNRIHRLDAAGKITTLYEQTNGANGLALNKAGELFAAEGDGKRISMRHRAAALMVLTDNVGGKPLLAPNDLILDSKGGIYFTDPGPRPVVAGRTTCICYLPAGAKQATVLDGAVGRPNGLTLTVDGKTLIVADTIGNT